MGALHFPPLLRPRHLRALHDLQMAANGSMRVFAFFCGLQPPRSWCWRVSGCARAAKNPFKQRWLKRTFAPESLLVKGRCGLRCLACQELQGWVAPKQGLRGMPAWPGDGRDGPRVGAQTRCVRAERQSCVQGCLQRALETTAPHTPISTLRTRLRDEICRLVTLACWATRCMGWCQYMRRNLPEETPCRLLRSRTTHPACCRVCKTSLGSAAWCNQSGLRLTEHLLERLLSHAPGEHGHSSLTCRF